ncbi:prolyl 4-hydroxylase subunit alpha-2-like isoform X1 [Stegostoma tigrinum]|uniref:prolyl 4-hydroxylase subunit alpha-2-like isoform X1 n=1 Tax=Stegostoma tigrinum TaxID=3053191 RepID=UPI00202B11E5|nr:prolyl 4-hydroxylase subunit alpha-2-like isoform X1 [Stegostoma tigrinum]
MKHLAVYLLAFWCYIWQTQAEFFTSIGQMTDLIYIEKDLVKSLKEYIKAEESKLTEIKSWAEKLNQLTHISTSDPEGYLGHPVNAYKLMKRLNTEWLKLESLVLQQTSDAFIANLSIQRENFPTDEDESGAGKAIMRLQDTYRLDSESISKGRLPGAQHIVPLTVDDCFELGKIAYNDADYYHTVLWMQQALKQLEEGEPSVLTQAEALDYLSYSVYQMGDIQRAIDLTKRLIAVDPTHLRAQSNLHYFKNFLHEEGQSDQARKDDYYQSQSKEEVYMRPENYLTERDSYESLCRGEGIKMTNRRRGRLFCRYHNNNNHPRLIIAPMKEEDEWDSPHIVRYHEMLSDAEIEKIKELAKPRLARATVRDPKTGVLTVANYRVSKSAWLDDDEDPVVNRVNQRIEDITGLEVDTAEFLQVANYGVGGQYEPHFDFSRRPFDSNLATQGNRLATFLNYKEEHDAFKELGTGNRLATFLNYMSDVPAGGATVFPDFGAAIYPKKGTAVFWYNLFRSGEGDYRTRHAACPVLVGSKWVSNKWIHERGQEFRRPCGLTEVD